MTLSEVIALYGLDVILLTVANAALAELLKRTLLKNKPKIVTAIIYAAGTVMYIVYESIRMKNALFFIDNASSAIEHGLSVGTLTVLLCAAVDRFFDGGSGTSAEDTIALILKGWVKSGKENDCAKKIIELKASQSGDEFIDGASELVAEYAADGVTAAQARLIAELACRAANGLLGEETTVQDGETAAEKQEKT